MTVAALSKRHASSRSRSIHRPTCLHEQLRCFERDRLAGILVGEPQRPGEKTLRGHGGIASVDVLEMQFAIEWVESSFQDTFQGLVLKTL